jgi:hypothetical protein
LPPGTAAFGLFGDTPYSEAEVKQLDALIDSMNAEELAFVVHIGDITSGRGPCTDDWFEARKTQFTRLRHPFVLLPGDNDWTDCWRSGFDPLERLEKWRSLFCYGETIFRLERQQNEYCEHVRWIFSGMLFVALNVQGSNNNLGRTKEMDSEHARRMAAVMEWLDSSAALVRERRLDALVVLMQANIFERRRGLPDGFAGIRDRLAALSRESPGRVVLVHGDEHTFRDDEPLPGLRRIEVHGSPSVRWLRAAIVGGGLQIQTAD